MQRQELQEARDRLGYTAISVLDPLQLDDIMYLLPRWNADREIGKILQATAEATEQAFLITAPSHTTALAAIRDLDFLVSSVVRHGVEPFHAIPALEGQLVRLGEAAQTVPRGTMFTYTAANPVDERQRTFTDTDEERIIIDSVTSSTVVLDGTIAELGQLTLSDNACLVTALNNSVSAMAVMIAAIVQVKRAITPEFFTFRIRPYFEPFTIAGLLLAGPGGSQMQLLAIDYILWGCEDDDVTYQTFFQDNWPYLTPTQRDAVMSYEQLNGKTSLVSWLCREGSGKACEAGVQLLNKIRSFRYPHRKVASDSFKLRPSDAVGSSQYRPDILDVLIVKTETAINRLKAC